MITSKRPHSTACRITVSRSGVWLETPRKRTFPASRSRSKASWSVGAMRRSSVFTAWMWARSRESVLGPRARVVGRGVEVGDAALHGEARHGGIREARAAEGDVRHREARPP